MASSVWGQTNSGSTVVSSSATNNTSQTAGDMDIFENFPRVQKVQLDGLTLLQIMKHCHDSAPKCVTGSLLGLDVQEHQRLEVTHSFPSPELVDIVDDPTSSSNSTTNLEEYQAEEYQIAMMNNLSEVNCDNNKVGWYQSAVLGSFCSASLIEYQFQYQAHLGPNTVCLIYDPAQTKQRQHLSLKAFRLSADFYQLYRKGQNITRENFAAADIRATTLLEEIPIELHNAELIQSWVRQSTVGRCPNFDQLDLSTNIYLENNLQYMSAWVNEFNQEHFKYQSYERNMQKQRQQHQQWVAKRKEENKTRKERGLAPLSEDDSALFKPLQQPSRLESLLITRQINTYCEQINHYTASGLGKLYLARSLHKDAI